MDSRTNWSSSTMQINAASGKRASGAYLANQHPGPLRKQPFRLAQRFGMLRPECCRRNTESHKLWFMARLDAGRRKALFKSIDCG
jgi:hypothetical protein